MKKIKKQGVMVGYIAKNEKYYVTEREPNKHLMNKYNGYGISENILRYIRGQGVQKVIVRTPERDYLFRVEDYLRSELEYEDNGDIQKFVRLSDDLCGNMYNIT